GLGLVDNAARMGTYLLAQLRDRLSDHPNVVEIRGEGLMAAVEFGAHKAPLELFDPSRKVGYALAAAVAQRNVITRAMPEGDILGLAPPLCITEGEIDLLVDAISAAVAEVF
ncbi:MAG TPA: aminotransferase class III-fold pyridoxal phosphate-dependent enzyme, partial [Aliiroseovarius sp.]|nr:aminotransferase class III-fold pyridoxal phosphate-dependent enzyme [Aliiroseovarius sp.]